MIEAESHTKSFFFFFSFSFSQRYLRFHANMNTQVIGTLESEVPNRKYKNQYLVPPGKTVDPEAYGGPICNSVTTDYEKNSASYWPISFEHGWRFEYFPPPKGHCKLLLCF